MIYDKNKKTIKPYVGDYKPINIYQGNKKIAGYTTETARGINAVELQNCYNEKLKAKVYGNSTQSILPVEYQQVEYLESTGTQYIDTGIKLKTTNKLEISFERIYSSEQFIFGSRLDMATEGYMVNLQPLSSGNNIFSSWSGGSAIDGLDNTANKKVALGNHIIKISSSGLLIDDVSYNCNVGSTNSTLNMYLFGLNQNGTLEARSKPFRIHYCKIWDGEILVNNFIPCTRNSGRVAGMYDAVNNVFYANSGTGTFILGQATPTIDTPAEIISVGDLVTEGENVGKYKIDVVNSGKNLFNRDGDLTLNYRIAFGGVELYCENGYFTTDYIKVKSNTNYTLNIPFTLNYNRISYYDNNKQFVSYFNGGVQTITTPSNAAYLKFGQLQNNIDTLMLEEGSVATDFEPYREPQTTTIYLDAPLRAIEVSSTDNYNVVSNDKYYVADYIDWKNKKIVRRIASVILNGTESWSKSGSHFTLLQDVGLKYYPVYINPKFLCNYFKCQSNNDSYINENNCVTTYTPSENYKFQKIVIKYNGVTTEQFKSWLSTNNTNVNYILATPIEEDITIEDINVIPNYCKVSVEVEQEPLALEVEYAKMEVE